jgi:hypothetical protein
LTQLPRRIGVIGAGPIGCEMAQTFAQLGAKVFLVEAEHGILPREDRDAAEIVQKAIQQDGVELLCCGRDLELKQAGGIRLTATSHGKVAARASGNRRFGAIDRAIGEGGWKIVALLRLSPAIPFNLQNYLYGLTPIRFWPYVLTSWLAMLPGTFLYVYLGHVAGAAIGAGRSRTVAEWAMLAVGLLATVVVTVYISLLARRKLHEQMEEPIAEEAAPATEDDDHRTAQQGASLRGTIMLAAVALVMVGAASTLVANSKAFEGWLMGIFGPPRVELKEAYAVAGAEGDETGASFDHSKLDALLREHVDDDGWVDYRGLKAVEPELEDYLTAVAEAPFDALGRDEKLALLINAYNACTLKLIVEHLPLTRSRFSAPDRMAAVRLDIEQPWQQTASIRKGPRTLGFIKVGQTMSICRWLIHPAYNRIVTGFTCLESEGQAAYHAFSRAGCRLAGSPSSGITS